MCNHAALSSTDCACGNVQEMTLDEYEKLMEEKNASLNKPAPKKADKADMKEFEGMTAYTRKVSILRQEHARNIQPTSVAAGW